MRTLRAFAVVFISSFSWFSLFQPWGAFRDPDAFYHAKMSSLFLEQGIIREFPWLDLTTLGASFVNQHFLYHVLNAPFVALFGIFIGHQIASVFFAALFLTAFYFVLRSLKLNTPWLWTALLAMTPPVLARLSLGKATPLAVGWLLLALFSTMKGKRWLMFFVMTLYVLTHGGWPLAFILAGGYFAGETVYEFYVKDARGEAIRLFFKKWALHFSALLGGTLLGLLLHPYRTNYFSFLYTQIFSIGVETPFDRVILGTEWRSYEIQSLIGNFAFIGIAALVVVFGFLFARRNKISEELMRWSIALGIPSAICFALTLKSRRFAEYLGPLLILWIAVLAMSIDWKQCWEEVKKLHVALRGLIAVLLLLGLGRGLFMTRAFLHDGSRSFDRIAPALSVIESRLDPSERVYNVNWPMFPELFAHSDRYKYIVGLDPVFLLRADPEKSDQYTAVMMGNPSVDPYEVVLRTFGSSIVVAEQRLDTSFIERVRDDARFKKVFEDEHFIVFEIDPPR